MSGDLPTSYNELYHPSATASFSATTAALNRSSLSISNRIWSIGKDASFVKTVSDRFDLPLIANERCGSWYIPTDKKNASAYFKSTDGHHGQWDFSTRRLNLHILELIGSHVGCIIVDSTRRGKSMPDALSKTVPIWCTVLNKLLFPEIPLSHIVRSPQQAVGNSENSQINAKLGDLLLKAENLKLDLERLRLQVRRPLIPFWVTPEFEDIQDGQFEDVNKVICCTASYRGSSDRPLESPENKIYVQGAGDDAENWANGLTPELLWINEKDIFAINSSNSDERLQQLIDKIKSLQTLEVHQEPCSIHGTSLTIGRLTDFTNETISSKAFDLIICCGDTSQTSKISCLESLQKTEAATTRTEMGVLVLHCRSGKLGSRDLRDHLRRIPAFVEAWTAGLERAAKTLVLCPSGKDFSVGVSVALLAWYPSIFVTEQSDKPSMPELSKLVIRQRLVTISRSKPDINPSRATLQSVHAILLPYI